MIRHIPGACKLLYWEGGSTVRPFDLFDFQIWVALDLPYWRLRKGSVAGLGFCRSASDWNSDLESILHDAEKIHCFGGGDGGGDGGGPGCGDGGGKGGDDGAGGGAGGRG